MCSLSFRSSGCRIFKRGVPDFAPQNFANDHAHFPLEPELTLCMSRLELKLLRIESTELTTGNCSGKTRRVTNGGSTESGD